jgi:hypothetical protein
VSGRLSPPPVDQLSSARRSRAVGFAPCGPHAFCLRSDCDLIYDSPVVRTVRRRSRYLPSGRDCSARNFRSQQRGDAPKVARCARGRLLAGWLLAAREGHRTTTAACRPAVPSGSRPSGPPRSGAIEEAAVACGVRPLRYARQGALAADLHSPPRVIAYKLAFRRPCHGYASASPPVHARVRCARDEAKFGGVAPLSGRCAW